MFKDAKTAFVLLVAFFSIGLTPAVLANGPELQIIGENQEELQPYQGLDYFCTPAAQLASLIRGANKRYGHWSRPSINSTLCQE